jgi:hypothetical protein
MADVGCPVMVLLNVSLFCVRRDLPADIGVMGVFVLCDFGMAWTSRWFRFLLIYLHVIFSL